MSQSDSPSIKKSGELDHKLAQFDYDTPVEEWPREEKEELLDLIAQLDCGMGEALRDIRGTELGDQS